MIDWHARFSQQACWTRPLRQYLYEKTGLANANRILDVGCGPGALLPELAQSTPAAIHGLDLNLPALKQAATHAPSAALTCTDAHTLPYPDNTFDISLCHYLLLWVHNPISVLCEMLRVTRPDGYVLALAEPDYTHRHDAPAALIPLGRLQTEALTRQGADPSIGARLGELFIESGIHLIETGELGRGASDPFAPDERELESAVLRADLTGYIPDTDIQKYEELEKTAWQRNERELYIPTHFAWGRA